MTATRKAAPPSPQRLQLDELAARLSESASVDAFSNGNGFVCVVEAPRPNGKVIRVIIEGGTTSDAPARAAAAALETMVSP